MSWKTVEDMSLNELVVYITETYHIPMRENLNRLDFLIPKVIEENERLHPELVHLKTMYNQFKTEVLKHVTKEDFVVFPSILKYEKIYSNHLINLTDNFEIMDKLVNNVKMKNDHEEFNLYLDSILELLEHLWIKRWVVFQFDEVHDIFQNIFIANKTHTKIENEDLYFKWMALQKKLQEKLANIM